MACFAASRFNFGRARAWISSRRPSICRSKSSDTALQSKAATAARTCSGLPVNEHRLLTSSVVRFSVAQRPTVTETLLLTEHSAVLDGHRLGKISNDFDRSILTKLNAQKSQLQDITTKSGKNRLFYQEACRYWLKASNVSPRFLKNGVKLDQPHGRIICFNTENASAFASLILNSSLFYWFYSIFSDCEHVNDGLVRRFKIPANWERRDWTFEANLLNEDMTANATEKLITTKSGDEIEYDEISASKSKGMIDEADRRLAELYGFSHFEADYLINYDIKYRMGADEDGANRVPTDREQCCVAFEGVHCLPLL